MGLWGAGCKPQCLIKRKQRYRKGPEITMEICAGSLIRAISTALK